MTSWFRSKRYCKLILAATASLVGVVLLFWSLAADLWTLADYQMIDRLYRNAVLQGKGPPASDRITYLTITDQTYKYFGNNNLDRIFLADVNQALGRLGVEAVAYDLIFARPSHPAADRRLADSIHELGRSYFPIGFLMEDSPQPFRWEPGAAFDRLRSDHLDNPMFAGNGLPLYGSRALPQFDALAEVAFNAGHISARSDADGVYRHVPMLIRVDRGYIPTLSLAMFLDFHRISLAAVTVQWGRWIVVPAAAGVGLKDDVIIPIDHRGRTYVPFCNSWKHDFKKMEAHRLLEYAQDPSLEGNLSEFFEGQFVFVGDVSTGVSDLGSTPLEQEVPLVALHAALLNGMLTNRFFTRWDRTPFFAVIFLLGLVLGAAAVFRTNGFLYAAGLGGGCFIVALAWHQFIHWKMVPVAGLVGSFFIIFFGLVISLQVAIAKEREYIKTAFSRYVPKKVVSQLLENPNLLQLGGGEREATVLFSDIVGFTGISETMAPNALVKLLNAYLTAMTDIVMTEGGIIDKYLGDAIMAEFGVPLAMPDHADRAVRAGLKMQQRLRMLRRQWRAEGLPALACRVGINTGVMVVGNMGSTQVFDYTVIGDAVNLASRLEGANKFYQTNVMISEFTRQLLTPGAFQIRLLDVVRVKGKAAAVRVYEVYGEDGDVVDVDDSVYYERYEAAMDAYLRQNFAEAEKQFAEALQYRPDDAAAQRLLDRLHRIEPDQLPANWDGAVSLTEK